MEYGEETAEEIAWRNETVPSPPNNLGPLNGSTLRLGRKACPTCSGTGYWRQDLPVGHPEFGKIHVCECNIGLKDRYRTLSGLDEHQRGFRLDDLYTGGFPGHARMREELEAFVRKPTGMLTIWGRPGNGKTLAAQAAISELLEGGVEAVYVRASELSTCMRQAQYPSGDVKNGGAYQRLLRIQEAAALAIDDFDRVYGSRGGQDQIDTLLELRYEAGIEGRQGTILVMDSDPAAQPEWMASRLFDGRNTVVHNDDPDLRRALGR